MNNPGEYALSRLRNLSPYVPGEQPVEPGWVKLNTNELPYDPSPEVAGAIASEVSRLSKYPEPASSALRNAIAEREKLEKDNVIIGNGSDELLNLLARLFGAEGNTVVQTFPGYSLYPILTSIAGGRMESVQFDQSMQLEPDRILQYSPNLVFLTAPNAPTGVNFPLGILRELAGKLDGILVIDEAYVDFAGGSARMLVDEFDHVVLTRTFSKSFGLAGLRVGYALASAEIISLLDRIRDSYNVNRLSQAGALAAYQDIPYYEDVIGKVIRTREAFVESLEGLQWKTYPSEANFVFTTPRTRLGEQGPDVARSLFDFLKAKRILVRYFPGHALTASSLRISIGNDSQMDQLLNTINEWQTRD